MKCSNFKALDRVLLSLSNTLYYCFLGSFWYGFWYNQTIKAKTIEIDHFIWIHPPKMII